MLCCDWKVNLKISIKFWLKTSQNRLSPEDGFRLLFSSNPLLKFRLVVSQDMAILEVTFRDLAILGIRSILN
jgi:hypothetical protein